METARRICAEWRSGPLNLSYLRLTKLPVLPATIQELVCVGNELTYLPEMLPVGLRYINCACNRIVQLPTVWPPALEVLVLRDNLLEGLPAVWPPTLRLLDYSWNLVREVDVMALPATLVELNCARCPLARIPDMPAGRFIRWHMTMCIAGLPHLLQRFPCSCKLCLLRAASK
jgi:hypothetical protein